MMLQEVIEREVGVKVITALMVEGEDFLKMEKYVQVDVSLLYELLL